MMIAMSGDFAYGWFYQPMQRNKITIFIQPVHFPFNQSVQTVDGTFIETDYQRKCIFSFRSYVLLEYCLLYSYDIELPMPNLKL